MIIKTQVIIMTSLFAQSLYFLKNIPPINSIIPMVIKVEHTSK